MQNKLLVDREVIGGDQDRFAYYSREIWLNPDLCEKEFDFMSCHVGEIP